MKLYLNIDIMNLSRGKNVPQLKLKKNVEFLVPNIAIMSSRDKTLSQTYTICNMQYIYNQHLIISKLDIT